MKRLFLLCCLLTHNALGQTLGATTVKCQSSTAATTLTTSSVTAQTTGSLFIAMTVQHLASAAAPTSVVDNNGTPNSYVLGKSGTISGTGGNFDMDMWYCINCSTGGAGYTVTATWAASGTGLLETLMLIEIKSAGALVLDSAPTGTNETSETSPLVAPSITTSQASQIVVDAFSTYGNNSSQTIGNNGTGAAGTWTLAQGENGGAGAPGCTNGALSWILESTTSTAVKDSFTWTIGDFGSALGLSFKTAPLNTTTGASMMLHFP